ncbi:MAG: hypothetical protein AB1489_36740 [Acidobacteriota bacterium]
MKNIFVQESRFWLYPTIGRIIVLVISILIATTGLFLANLDKIAPPAKEIQLQTLVQELSTSTNIRKSYREYSGKQVSFKARVFNTEVNTETYIYRLLLDPPLEARSVIERLDNKEKIVMIACTSRNHTDFENFNSGDEVVVQGRLDQLDDTNHSWITILMQDYKILTKN